MVGPQAARADPSRPTLPNGSHHPRPRSRRERRGGVVRRGQSVEEAVHGRPGAGDVGPECTCLQQLSRQLRSSGRQPRSFPGRSARSRARRHRAKASSRAARRSRNRAGFRECIEACVDLRRRVLHRPLLERQDDPELLREIEGVRCSPIPSTSFGPGSRKKGRRTRRRRDGRSIVRAGSGVAKVRSPGSGQRPHRRCPLRDRPQRERACRVGPASSARLRPPRRQPTKGVATSVSSGNRARPARDPSSRPMRSQRSMRWSTERLVEAVLSPRADDEREVDLGRDGCPEGAPGHASARRAGRTRRAERLGAGSIRMAQPVSAPAECARGRRRPRARASSRASSAGARRLPGSLLQASVLGPPPFLPAQREQGGVDVRLRAKAGPGDRMKAGSLGRELNEDGNRPIVSDTGPRDKRSATSRWSITHQPRYSAGRRDSRRRAASRSSRAGLRRASRQPARAFRAGADRVPKHEPDVRRAGRADAAVVRELRSSSTA